MAHRLADATSPYLLQHADNPVDWWPWGSEAFDEARRRDVPVFVSVGYSACHWCHVMAHETFEDEAVAALLAAHVVSIKVDREERPDVDAVLMSATTALTGQGGWPLSIFLTPEGRPFWAGTYLPPTPRHGQPSFRQVVEALTQAWREKRGEVTTAADEIVRHLVEVATPVGVHADTDAALARIVADSDAEHGGFGAAPKFPQPMVLDALLATGRDDHLAVAGRALTAMADGGIHDQLAGGFARYSVDAGWVVPHFEKMLSDNALLLATYARAAARGHETARFTEVCEGIVGWLEGEMLTEGGFAASLDADSLDADGRSREGAAYVWSREQLTAVLGADGPAAADAFGVSETGTFEPGLSTLRRRAPIRPEWRTALLAARRERPAPARNDVVITAWNGWAVVGLVEAGMLLDRPEWVALAARVAESVWTTNRPVSDVEGAERLLRTSRDGRPGPAPAALDDHGALAHGLALLAAATGQPHWLGRAERLLLDVDRYFARTGGYSDDADDADPEGLLFTRPAELVDNATPSGLSSVLAAQRLVTGLRGEAQRPLPPLAVDVIARAPRFAGWQVRELVRARRPEVDVTVVGPDRSLAVAAWRAAPDGAVVLWLPEPDDAWALATGRVPEPDTTAAWVCRDQTCRAPVTSVDELVAVLVAVLT